MPIVALEEPAVRAIGSTSALSDSSSVVKELLDNALDAGATSIFLEISHNTLDIIQVKDNGSGILPSDRSLACKRNYTSKIQTKEDLKNVGGKSLGFRGQALASIAEMSHAVHITTRVLEEQVARTVKFGRDGEPISETPASHPIGTTVRVCNFLQSLPVRRQEAEKKSTKSILAIKKLLQGYAIARPKTRLSMRLLKSKEQDWIYAPSPSPSARDAISQIIGSTVISSCISLNSCHPVTRGRDSSDSVIEGHDTLTIHVSVVVPKPAAECAVNINHKGQFVIVDTRPLLTCRGFGKEVFKLFKSYYKTAVDSTRLEDPFMFLSLDCPPGIYDANIEPSKDDIVFEDNRAVLHIIESVFMDIYSPETSTIIPTPDTRQSYSSNQLTVDISSPASTKNCGRFRTNETLTPTINPWTLSLAAQRLRDPESHLLTPQREFQAPQNNLPPRSPNISMKGGRASMRQAKLSLHDNGRVSLFDTQSPRRRINGSPRTATPPQVPAPNITRGIETSLQTAERNSTRGNGGAHVIRPAPQTPPLSRARSITTRQQAPIAVTCSRSNDPIFPNPHYISERLHRNHSSDHENSGYCEIHPYKLTVPSGSRLHTVSTNLKSRFQPDLNQKCNHLTNHGKNSFSTEILRDQSQSPMECLPSMGPAYETTIPNGGEITQLADSIKLLVNTDQYVKSGSFMAAFSPVNSTGSISYWTNKLHTLAKKPSFQRRLRQLSFLTPDNPS
ncbi:PMS1 protein homolog [Trichophyton mentagrophytes]|nr:PMS1 protein homolog [Trichophyton mentagrophytes]